jgi:hypothetical protein
MYSLTTEMWQRMSTVELAKRQQSFKRRAKCGLHHQSVSPPRYGCMTPSSYQLQFTPAKHGKLQRERRRNWMCSISAVYIKFLACYRDDVTNGEILRRIDLRRLQDIVTERRLRLAGYVLRLPDNCHPKTAMWWISLEGKGNKEDQRRHGSKHSKKVCETLVLNGMKQGPFQQIDDSAEHLLPSVSNCTGGTKTRLTLESSYNYRTKLVNEC